MKYNIYDMQLHEYYFKNITLEEAKNTAIRLMEQVVEEDDEEYRDHNKNLLEKIKTYTTREQIAEALEDFEYHLEAADGDNN